MSNASPTPSQDFTVVDTLRDPDGVVATVTERARDGRISFALGKEYDRGGSVQRTPYLGRRHIAALRRVIDDLEERLELLEDRARARRRA